MLPELGPDHRGITFRHLLAHASGLPAWRPLHAAGHGRDALVAAAAPTPLEAAPGYARALLGPGLHPARRGAGAGGGSAPRRALRGRVSGPLGLADTFFLREGDPVSAARRAQRRFAAARRTPERGVIVGEVDDDNAFAMGGVAGHAGLFSSASDVAALGQAWLEALAGRSRWLSAATAARFVARDATPGTERALGWDTPSAQGSALGTRLGQGPRGAVGHLGFTGCSLWIDLDRELACALLTNHVHPDGPDKAAPQGLPGAVPRCGRDGAGGLGRGRGRASGRGRGRRSGSGRVEVGVGVGIGGRGRRRGTSSMDYTGVKRIHLIGVAGTGMGSFAGMLKAAGYQVTGSDENVYPPMSTQLARLGHRGHDALRAGEPHARPARPGRGGERGPDGERRGDGDARAGAPPRLLPAGAGRSLPRLPATAWWWSARTARPPPPR